MGSQRCSDVEDNGRDAVNEEGCQWVANAEVMTSREGCGKMSIKTWQGSLCWLYSLLTLWLEGHSRTTQNLPFSTAFHNSSHIILIHNFEDIESRSDKLVIMCVFVFSWSLNRRLDPCRAFEVQSCYRVRENLYLRCVGGLLMLHQEAKPLDGDLLLIWDAFVLCEHRRRFTRQNFRMLQLDLAHWLHDS